MILNQLRHLRLVMALLILWACSSVAKAQTNYGIRRKMLCHQEFMAAIMQTCCVCISSSLPLILFLLMKSSAVVNEDVLAQIAKSYTDYLLACKAEGMQFIQPGRFVLPGELEGAPVLQFFPLLYLAEEEWSKLKREAKSNSHSPG